MVINFPFLQSGLLDTVFHKTWLAISIFGVPPAGYKVNLIGLLIITLIALGAAAVTERLAGAKPGGLLSAVLITLLGAWLFSVYVNLPFEILMENVRLIAAFLGAVVVAVFYVLIRKQFKGGK